MISAPRCILVVDDVPDNRKKHPSAWPVTSLTLGNQTYTRTDLLIVLSTPLAEAVAPTRALFPAQS